jgi:hypothetical protein
LTTAAVLLAAGCAATDDVTLELADANGDCTGATIAAVKTLSIEAIATDGRCRLAHQCAFNVMVQSVAGLAAALRVTDVLLELDAGEAQTLVINGRPSYDCFPREDGSNHPVLCGYASLDRARDGALVLELQRDGGNGECPESIALCP